MPGGADGQIGWKSESAAAIGTAVTVDNFLPFTSESIKQNIEYLDTQTISARKVLRLTKQGSKMVEGSVSTELANTDLVELLAHMFGGVAFGTGTHTFTPGNLTGKALTVQVGRPASTGTVHAFTYAGCKIANWSISASVGEIANLEFSLIGMTETTATALATAAYDATWSPYVFTEAAITVAGSPVATVKSLELSGDNALEPRVRMGAQTSREPLEIGLRTYEGTVTTDFDNLTHYNLYTAGTQTALVATFTNTSAFVLTFTMNVQFTGETPEVGGFDLLEQNLPFRVISSTSDAAGITATLKNAETEFTFPA
jgi:hypothetical protein